jgi:acyl carrier protein
MRHEEVYTRVAATVAETLNLDTDDEIQPSSRLQADLGAESIDIVDLMFRLENEFGIDIPESDFCPATLFQQHPEYVRNGRLTEQGLAALQDRWPCANLGTFTRNPEPIAVNDLLSVDYITRYVQSKLSEPDATEADHPDGRRRVGRALAENWTFFLP